MIYIQPEVEKLENVPAELSGYHSWIVWREEPPRSPKAKPGKIPVNPLTMRNASTIRKDDWTSRETAVSVYSKSKTLAGVGFVFTPEDPFAGVDIDHCRDKATGEIDPWARQIIDRFNSYTEVSPSGTGVKLFIRACVEGRRNHFETDGHEVEVYDRGRYFAVTGEHVDGTPAVITENQSLVNELLPMEAVHTATEPVPRETDPAAAAVDQISDTDLIQRIRDSGQGEKFDALMEGSTTGYAGYFAASGALCTILAAWTRCNPERIDRIYRTSGLYEESWWDDRRYAGRRIRGERTITESCALAATGWMFDPTTAEATINGGIVLPGGEITITESAKALFTRIAATQKLFVRGGSIQRVVKEGDVLKLKILAPVDARSEFEKYGKMWAYRVGQRGDEVLKRAIIPLQTAAAFLACDTACELLPAITGLINCPVMVFANSNIQMIGPGYHAETGLFITGGTMPPVVKVKEAVKALKELVAEFDFQSDGDHSRSLASFITPGLKLGGFLRGNIPADVAEADKSQSGKTYRQRLVAGVYNEKPSLVTNRVGGVGSIDESLNAALEMGRPFIQFDNFRGKFDSQHVEAFMTAEDLFPVRLPYAREFNVDPSRFFVMLSSNGVETTPDFANRSNIVRNRKRESFTFKQYTEGSLLDYVRANQAYYLGCVFAVIRDWVAQGCKRTKETRHDFREWAQTLDWIVQNILQEVPLMEGHESAQERVSNPDLTFLRKLAIAVADQNRLTDRLMASTLYEIAESAEVPIPGLREPNDDTGKRQIGVVMGRLFKTAKTLSVDEFTIVRHEVETARADGGGAYIAKTYEFNRT